MSVVSEEWISAIKDGSAPVFRYLSADPDESTVSASVVYVLSNKDETTWIYGAYYGYGGGGENDGGFFCLNSEGEIQHLDFGEVDELGSESPELQSLYESLIAKVWEVMDDDDGELKLNEAGTQLIADCDDGVYLSDGFDGDALAGISGEWKITLRFEE